MVTRYSVALDGVELHDIADKVIITDINETTPAIGISTMNNAGYDGQRVLRQYRQNLQVAVYFSVEEYDVTERKSVISEIQKWCINGGKLTIVDRPDQFLNVVCTQIPTVSSSKKWLDQLSVVFTAYAMPFWQSVNVQTITIDAQVANVTTNKSEKIDGFGRCFVQATIKNTDSKAMTTVTMKCGSCTIKLSGISLPAGKSLSVSLDKNQLVSIKQGETSLMSKRTSTSSDYLWVNGNSTAKFSVNASTKCKATFNVRGAYL